MSTDTQLSLKWTVSRARDTYGYNVVTLTDAATGKRHRRSGGGYDMTGAVLGSWLQDAYQDELVALADACGSSTEFPGQVAGWYGMYRWRADGPVALNGACGVASMQAIAEGIGVRLTRTYTPTGNNHSAMTGWVVSTGARGEGDQS